MTPRERLFALEHFGIKLGLDNIFSLLRALDHPERAFPSVHIAGTNGKGSVTAMVERGLRAAGQRTGRYTSPHLAHIEERIAIDGRPVSAADFDAAVEDVLALIARLRVRGELPGPPTFFETTTAMAFELFRRQGVTAAVIEVGLGGRYDATNVVTPVISAITSIALDHERHLGATLAQIAFEKAGIIKTGVPVVVGPLPPDASDVVSRVAREVGAPLVNAAPRDHGEPISLAMHGRHQRDNAAVAVELLRGCADRFGTTRAHVVAALTDVEWPGRLEWLRVAGQGDLLIDAAHNPAGARSLADYVAETTGPLPMVVAAMQDKDVASMARALAPAVSRFVATDAPTPRAWPATELGAAIAGACPDIPVDVCPEAAAAVERALKDKGRAMAGGSIYFIGPLRDRLVERGAVAVRYPSRADVFFLDW